MLKSLVLLSVLALGASAQALPDMGNIPASCKGQCQDAASLGSECTAMDTACLESICKNASKFKSCLECANMSDLYDMFAKSCSALGQDTGGAAASDPSHGTAPAAPAASGAAPGSSADNAGTDSDSGTAQSGTAAATGSTGSNAGAGAGSAADAAPSSAGAAAAGASPAPGADSKTATGAESGARALSASAAGVAAAVLAAALF